MDNEVDLILCVKYEEEEEEVDEDADAADDDDDDADDGKLETPIAPPPLPSIIAICIFFK